MSDSVITRKESKTCPADSVPINSREYHFDGAKGEAIIQEHSLGHPQFGGEAAKPHFNVRPAEKPRTGTYPNTKGHYVFSKKNK